MPIYRGSVLATLGALLLLFAADASASPEIALSADQVSIGGLAAGGGAAVMSVSRELLLDAVPHVVRYQELLVDDDGDGIVTVALDREAPPASLWIAVDLTTGESAVQAPDGFPLRSLELDPRRVRKALGRLDVDLEDGLFLAVRPGVGAWSLEVGDGGADDDDGASDGRVTLAQSRLRPLGDSPPVPLDGFAPGDLLAAIDVRRMQLVILRVSG